MGFPRILSKSNKMYTKLGDFCLSSDGNQFYILCHICQHELHTQDTFWKHVQDEHSFMHELSRQSQIELNRLNSGQVYVDGVSATAGAVIDLKPPSAALVSHFRKDHIKAECVANGLPIDDETDDADENEDEPKDYTEMRVIEPSDVEVNIKVEQTNLGNTTDPVTLLQQEQRGTASIYMPNTTAAAAPAALMSPHHYSNIFQNMTQVCAAVPTVPVPNTRGEQDALPKDSSSATSEDGERWYICDYNTCGLKFKYQSRLSLHRSVHSKVRRFVCDMCNASFKQSCNLSTHRKKKHNIRTARMAANE